MSIKYNLFLPERALKVFLTLLFSFLLVGEASAAKSYKGYSNLPEPPATTKGESIYRESDCSLCHGEMGDGEGFLAAGLIAADSNIPDRLFKSRWAITLDTLTCSLLP